MTSPDPAVVRIINAHMAANEQVRARVAAFVTRVWDSLDSWREADIARFIRAILPVILGAEQQVAALTDGYLGTIAAAVLGGSERPIGVRVADVTGAALRGVEPAEVYRRTGITVWTALANGQTLNDAVNEGGRRALSLAMTDLQLARTHTARAVFSRDERVVGHRRTLSGSENCGICHLAASQRYKRADLQPIHPGCDCGVEPIYGREDPGQVIDPDGRDQAHAAIEERFGSSDDSGRGEIDYRKVLLVREHGELGPVLTVKGQNFTGPSDL